jgi:sugar/nucleoside kinase (ribokinase family)
LDRKHPSRFTPELRYPCDGPTVTSASLHPERSFCVAGLVFLDVVMVGLEHAPRPGEEQWVPECQMMPGGVAIQAVALARFGVSTTLVAQIGKDPAGGIVAEMLACEDVDTSYATPIERQSVTTSLAFDGDRAMTTFGAERVPPLSTLTVAPAGLICDMRTVEANRHTLRAWRQLPENVTDGSTLPKHEAPTWVLADVGWDPTGKWDPGDLSGLDLVDVFTPNAQEAMEYTRTESVEAAAHEIAKHVSTVVITLGAEGIFAISNGQEHRLPALSVPVVDPTGAGDSFAAGVSLGYSHRLPMKQSLSLGMLAGAFAVGQPGGSAFAPTLRELTAWSKTVDIPSELDLEFLDNLEDTKG